METLPKRGYRFAASVKRLVSRAHDSSGYKSMLVVLPFEINWYRTTFRGTTRGTVALTEGRVKFFAAMGPVWITAWILLVSWMDVPPTK
jgi:hypothetical protein